MKQRFDEKHHSTVKTFHEMLSSVHRST